MSSPTTNKRSGAKAETTVVDFLATYGLPAFRVRLNGTQDLGDIRFTDPQGDAWIFEVKLRSKQGGLTAAIRDGLAELPGEMVNAGVMHGAVVATTSLRNPVETWPVVMPLAAFLELLGAVPCPDEVEAV